MLTAFLIPLLLLLVAPGLGKEGVEVQLQIQMSDESIDTDFKSLTPGGDTEASFLLNLSTGGTYADPSPLISKVHYITLKRV